TYKGPPVRGDNHPPNGGVFASRLPGVAAGVPVGEPETREAPALLVLLAAPGLRSTGVGQRITWTRAPWARRSIPVAPRTSLHLPRSDSTGDPGRPRTRPPGSA